MAARKPVEQPESAVANIEDYKTASEDAVLAVLRASGQSWFGPAWLEEHNVSQDAVEALLASGKLLHHTSIAHNVGLAESSGLPATPGLDSGPATDSRGNGAAPPPPSTSNAIDPPEPKPAPKPRAKGKSPFTTIEELRGKNEKAFAGEVEVSSAVSYGRPDKAVYFRCPKDEGMYLQAKIWVDGKDQRKAYYVDPDMWDLEDLQGALKPVLLVPWMGANGELGLWAISLNDSSEWSESAHRAVAEAKEGWIRVQSVKEEGYYKIIYPKKPIKDRLWPEYTVLDFCAKAFGSRYVVSEDDALIRNLRNLGPS
jgi:hypothetical protein